MDNDKKAILILILTVVGIGFFLGYTSAEIDAKLNQTPTTSNLSPPTLEVLEDKQRGVVCYKLDWSDTLSCLPSQWLYEAGEMK